MDAPNDDDEEDEKKGKEVPLAIQHLYAIAEDKGIDLADLKVSRRTITTSLRRILKVKIPSFPRHWRQAKKRKWHQAKRKLTREAEVSLQLSATSSGLLRNLLSLALHKQLDSTAPHPAYDMYDGAFDSNFLCKQLKMLAEDGQLPYFNPQLDDCTKKMIKDQPLKVLQYMAQGMRTAHVMYIRNWKKYMKNAMIDYLRGVMADLPEAKQLSKNIAFRVLVCTDDETDFGAAIDNICQDESIENYANDTCPIDSILGFACAVCERYFDLICELRPEEGKSYGYRLRALQRLRLIAEQDKLDPSAYTFALLPYFSPRDAFNTYDWESVTTFYNQLVKRHDLNVPYGTTNARTPESFGCLFNFFKDDDPYYKRNKPHRDKRNGLPCIDGMKEAFSHRLKTICQCPPYPSDLPKKSKSKCKCKRAEKKKVSVEPLPNNSKFSEFVSVVNTDGLQAKVVLVTLVPKRKQEEDNTQTAAYSNRPAGHPCHKRGRGVPELTQRNYSSVKDKLNVSKDTTGIYGGVAKNSPPPSGFRIIPVDPGQVEIVTYASESFDEQSPGDMFKDMQRPATITGTYSNTTYRKKAWLDENERFEAARREANPEYRAAVEGINNYTLRKPGGAAAYVSNALSTITVRMKELCTHERRLHRFRAFIARQRCYHEIALQTVYCDVFKSPERDKSGQREQAPGVRQFEKELQEKRAIKDRIVIFGGGTYPHGRRGPSPRKAVIRAVAKICPVLIVDEFRTSKMCHRCGAETIQKKERILTCSNKNKDVPNCPDCDRDINGTGNMGQIGIAVLLHLPRPKHVQRPKKNKPKVQRPKKKKRKRNSSTSESSPSQRSKRRK